MLGNHHLTFAFKTLTDRKKVTSSVPIRKPAERVEKEAVDSQHTIVEEPIVVEKRNNPKLIIEASTDPSVRGQVITIENFPYTLGRLHPQFTSENDQRSQKYFITDLQSTNGVTIENKSIPSSVPMEIIPGCRIGLGNTLVLRFEL
jgi:hypothetical protein